MNYYRQAQEMAVEVYTPDTLEHAIRLYSIFRGWEQLDEGNPAKIISAGVRVMVYAVTALLHELPLGNIDQVRALGFSPLIVDALNALLQRPQEDYFDYIYRVMENEVARSVKLADLNDDMWGRPAPDLQWRSKYLRAEKILRGGKKIT